MPTLKRALFDAYGRFADKRIKNLDKSALFIVDDRSPGDYGADGELYSYFCLVFAEVLSDSEVAIVLRGNVPLSSSVEAWIEKHGAEWSDSHQKRLSFKVTRGQQGVLLELAGAIASIVGPGAKYGVPSYKYVCPRTAKSLKRLAVVLADSWAA